MGIVHGLEGDTGVITVEVAVLDQVFDGVDDLEAGLNDGFRIGLAFVLYLLEQIGLL